MGSGTEAQSGPLSLIIGFPALNLSGDYLIAERRTSPGELPDGEDDRAILRAYAQAGAPVEQYVEMMARCRRIGEPHFVRDLLVAHPEWDRPMCPVES